MTERRVILFRDEIAGDLRPLGRLHRDRILTAIEERLALEPERYGKPLGGNLAGLRRVRVGDYRIVYQVKGAQVVVWAVLHRKTVYAEIVKRFFRR